MPPTLPIVLATGNAHKVLEITRILDGLTVQWFTADRWPEMTEPEESGETYEANARIKARAWCERTGLWSLADDSGIEVAALGGRPGLRSARYAPTASERLSRMLGELASVPLEERTARFVCCAVLAGPDGREFVSTGVLPGRIAFEARGVGGFGYDPLFVPEGSNGRHLAEYADTEKDAISHRGRALRGLRDSIAALIGQTTG